MTVQRFRLGAFARPFSTKSVFPKQRPGSYSDLEICMEPIRVIYHHEPEGWWAESPDVKGWIAAGDSYPEVLKLAKEGIPFALECDESAVELKHFVPAGESISAAA